VTTSVRETWSEVGFWWLPEAPDEKVSGTLSYSPDEGLELKLVGSFTPITDAFGAPPNCPIILGITAGKLVTLVGCMQSGTSMSFPGFQSESFIPRFALLGVHVESTDDLIFDEIDLLFSNFGDWVDVSGITQNMQAQDDAESGAMLKRMEIAYEPTKGPSAAIGGGSVEVGFDFSASGGMTRNPALHETAVLTVKLDAAITVVETFDRYVTPFANLLTLAIDRPIAIEAIRVSNETTRADRAHRNADLVFCPVHLPEAHDGRILANDMLFHTADLDEVGFDGLVQQWLRIADGLAPVCALFFSVRYAQLPIELRFLNLIRAIEVYHRRTDAGGRLPPDEWEEKLARIIESAPEEDREWLEEELRWSNEVRLRARLRKLLETVSDALEDVLPRKFVGITADTRNYLTHYDDSLKGRALEGADLYRISEVLIFFLQACFLHELGFSSERIASLLRRNRRFAFAAQLRQRGE
jgi:ApeA N-terminal domain 1